MPRKSKGGHIFFCILFFFGMEHENGFTLASWFNPTYKELDTLGIYIFYFIPFSAVPLFLLSGKRGNDFLTFKILLNPFLTPSFPIFVCWGVTPKLALVFENREVNTGGVIFHSSLGEDYWLCFCSHPPFSYGNFVWGGVKPISVSFLETQYW